MSCGILVSHWSRKGGQLHLPDIVTKINFFCKFSSKNTLWIVDQINFSGISKNYNILTSDSLNGGISIDQRGRWKRDTPWLYRIRFSKLCGRLSLEIDCLKLWWLRQKSIQIYSAEWKKKKNLRVKKMFCLFIF